MGERRKYPRINEGATVAVMPGMGQEFFNMGSQPWFCAARDISVGGMQFDLHDGLRDGMRVELEIALDNPFEKFVRSGAVAWVNQVCDGFQYTTGICFSDLNSSRWLAWRDALAARYGETVMNSPSV